MLLAQSTSKTAMSHLHSANLKSDAFLLSRRYLFLFFFSSVTRELLYVIMAGGQLLAEPSLPVPGHISEDGELSENDDFQSFQTLMDKPHEVNSRKRQKQSKKTFSIRHSGRILEQKVWRYK